MTISGLMERRLWTWTAGSQLCPNLYVMLVSPPGVGKSMVISHVRAFWMDVKDLQVAPNNMTKAALLDTLQGSKRTHLLSPTDLLEYHGLQIAASEFGVFCPEHDLEFLSTLSELYDCGPSFRENRRAMRGEQIDITNPQLTIIAGSQPGYLQQFLPEAAWGQGFMARVVMIYSDERMRVNLFSKVNQDPELRGDLLLDAKQILGMTGCMTWSPDAEREMIDWYEGGARPEPQHFKLHNYNTRRHMQVLKLAMISRVSRGGDLEIQSSDVRRGIAWLLEAETFMPEIFKAMRGNSDQSILQELKIFVATKFIEGGKPIHEAGLISFLSPRTFVGNIMRMIEIAEKSGLIAREVHPTGNFYRPGLADLPPET